MVHPFLFNCLFELLTQQQSVRVVGGAIGWSSSSDSTSITNLDHLTICPYHFLVHDIHNRLVTSLELERWYYRSLLSWTDLCSVYRTHAGLVFEERDTSILWRFWIALMDDCPDFQSARRQAAEAQNNIFDKSRGVVQIVGHRSSPVPTRSSSF